MQILHFADAHVGCKTHGKRNPESGLNSRLHDAVAQVKQIADLSREADLALFAGDGFEHPNPTPTQQRLFLDAIKEFDCPIIATTGNHDVPSTEGRSHALDLLNEVENVHLIDEPGIYYVNVPERLSETVWQIRHSEERKASGAHNEDSSGEAFVLTVLPWPLEYQSPGDTSIKHHYLNLLEEGLTRSEELGMPALAMGHFTVEGSLPSGSEASLQLNGEVTFSPADFEGYDYTALGHIHQYQNLGENAPVVYSSCPMRKSFSEEGDRKGAVLLDLSAPENYSFEEIEARPFRTIEADLTRVETSEPVTSRLVERVEDADTEDAIVRVRYKAPEGNPIDEREIKEALSDAHNVASIERTIERERQSRTEDGADPDASLDDLIGEFAESRDLTAIKTDLKEVAGEIQENV